MFFWSLFLKTHKKSYWLSKTPSWPFLAVNNVFLYVFKNTDQITFVSLLFKAKTEKELRKKIGWPPKRSLFKFWNKNRKKCSSYFSFVLHSFKNNRPTNVIFISVFENAQKTVINRQKRPKWCFWRSIIFFVLFQKYQPKKKLCVYCF